MAARDERAELHQRFTCTRFTVRAECPCPCGGPRLPEISGPIYLLIAAVRATHRYEGATLPIAERLVALGLSVIPIPRPRPGVPTGAAW